MSQSNDEEVLARVMRRYLEDPEEPYVDVKPGAKSMCLDGWVSLLPGEADILDRIKRAAPK